MPTTQDYIQKSSDGTSVSHLEDSIIYQDDANSRIGIGTTSPHEKSEVAGNARLNEQTSSPTSAADSATIFAMQLNSGAGVGLFPRVNGQIGIDRNLGAVDWVNAMDFGAGSSQATVGSIAASSTSLTLANAIDFQNGQGICVKGAGASGADLITSISSGGGTTSLNLAASATTAVSGTIVSHATTGSINASSTSLTLANAMEFQTGHGIYVHGAGASGADLITTVAGITDSTHLTLATAASTTVSGSNAVVRHDDSSAIQAAITTLQQSGAYSTPQGGTIYLPSGHFSIGSSLLIGEGYTGSGGARCLGSGIQIIGAGAEKTILTINNSAGMAGIRIMGGQNAGNEAKNSQNVVIKNLQITLTPGQNNMHTGIEIFFGCDVLVENVRINGLNGSNNFLNGIKCVILSSAQTLLISFGQYYCCNNVCAMTCPCSRRR